MTEVCTQATATLAKEAEAQLLDLIAAMLAELRTGEAPRVTLDDALEEDLGIDSLARAELALRIEVAFDARLPEGPVEKAHTVRDLAAALASASPRATRELGPATDAVRAGRFAGVPRAAETLMEVLAWHESRQGEGVHATLLGEDDRIGTLTYRELAAGARAVATGLGARGLGRGETVAIMLPTGAEFLFVFLGVLLAGGVPVPLYPPVRRSQIGDHLRRQALILANCEARFLVTTAEATAFARLEQLQVPRLRHILEAARLVATETASALLPRPGSRCSDTALVQYTSGSTGQPKGVVLSHANLLANIRAMGEAGHVTRQDVFVSWLPLYHDMGLIGAWLGSLYHGIPLVLMAPQRFLSRPARWLEAIHRHRGTLSGAPNFAYELLATRVPDDELRGLDLSSWRLAFNGAEPVRASTLEKFARRYEHHGFDRRSQTPVYGLAECSLCLTVPPLGRGPLIEDMAGSPGGVVSCGKPLHGHELRIVDPAGRELPERREGRVEFRGPSATAGYYGNAIETAKLIRDGWLDTGDVGYLAAGELFVTGRSKEIVIRGGQHIHPYDLEESVGALAGVRKGCVAVFGATAREGGERLIVAAETRVRDRAAREALKREIARVALAQLGAPADDIVLVEARALLKTSSGKMRRAACRELYEQGRLGAESDAVILQIARIALQGVAGRTRLLARTVGDYLFAAYAWALFGGVAACGFAVLALPGPRRRRRCAGVLARFLVAASGVPVRWTGDSRLPDGEAAVVVANHASYCDFILLAALQRHGTIFVAKREFASHPVIGPLLKRLGVLFVERVDVAKALADAREIEVAVRNGESVTVFPEGRLTRAAGLGPFHLGAFASAAGAGCPVVPVALSGTRSVLRDGSWLPRRRPVEVHVGKPVRPANRGWTETLRLRNEARRAILERCGEPDLDPNPPVGDLYAHDTRGSESHTGV